MGAAHVAGRVLGAAVVVCGAHFLVRSFTGRGLLAHIEALFEGPSEPWLPPPPSDPLDEASWESFPASDPPAHSPKNT